MMLHLPQTPHKDFDDFSSTTTNVSKYLICAIYPIKYLNIHYMDWHKIVYKH